MFKKWIVFSASLLLTSGILAPLSAWSVKQDMTKNLNQTAQQATSKLTTNSNFLQSTNITHFNVKDTPGQIVAKIKQDHIFVPYGTNPITTNPQTLLAIKNALQKANPALTSADMQDITIQGTSVSQLSSLHYTMLTAIVTDGSAFNIKQIYVELANKPSPAVSIYNPDYQVNQFNIDYSYDDDVFLKCLVYNPLTKTVTFDSSRLTDPRDQADYQQMAKTNNIKPDLVLLNRYLQNNFLRYNPQGHIPSRQELLSNNAFSDKQTLIVQNTAIAASDNSIGDYLTFHMHWDGFSVVLKKIINAVIAHLLLHLISPMLAKAPVKLFKSIAEYASKLKEFVTKYVTQIVTEFDLDVDDVSTEIPGIGEIIDGIEMVLSAIIASESISTVLGYFENSVENLTLKNYVNENSGFKKKMTAKNHYIFQLPGNLSSLMNYTMSINVRLSSLFEGQSVTGTSQWNHSVLLPSALGPSKIKNVSLESPSMISGNPSDFTIAVTKEYLDELNDDLSFPTSGFTKLNQVFHQQQWQNYANFKNADKPIFTALQNFDHQSLWIVPIHHMAVIHIRLINGSYQIVWSNLTTSKLKVALPESKDGELNASIIGENNLTHLLINERVSSQIMTRWVWVSHNWNALKNYPSYKPYLNAWAYFKKNVLGASHINNYQVCATDLLGALNQLTLSSTHLIQISHILNTKIAPAQILSVYFNNVTQNIDIQSD